MAGTRTARRSRAISTRVTLFGNCFPTCRSVIAQSKVAMAAAWQVVDGRIRRAEVWFEVPGDVRLCRLMSGALRPATWTEEELKDFKAIRDSVFGVFGPMDSDTRKANDIHQLGRNASAAQISSLPYFYLDCGTGDVLANDNPGTRRSCIRKRSRTSTGNYPAITIGNTGISRCGKC